MKKVASFLSYLFHPLWWPLIIIVVLQKYYPALWVDGSNNAIIEKTKGLWIIQTAFNTILYPLVVTFLIWKLGFTQNMYMRTSKERLGPLMASILFYFWNFYVFHKVHEAPIAYKQFLLATFICTSILFVLTIFVKVSMHIAAITSVLVFFILMLPVAAISKFIVIAIAFILIITIWARLALQEHTKAEIILGALVGIVSMLGSWYGYLRYAIA